MTTAALNRPVRRGWDGLRRTVKSLPKRAKVPARLAGEHVLEHGYTMLALMCWSAAWFTHSVFAGLIATAGSFFVLEWKVKD